MDAKVPPLGWLDVTDVAIQALGLTALGVDTTVAYHFFSNTAKEPVAIITLDNSQSRVTSAQYKTNRLVTAVTSINPVKLEVSAFPNPASSKVRMSFNNMESGQYMLKIYNVLGMQVLGKTYQIPGKQFETELDVSTLVAGIYFYSLLDNRGIPLITKQLIIVKS